MDWKDGRKLLQKDEAVDDVVIVECRRVENAEAAVRISIHLLYSTAETHSPRYQYELETAGSDRTSKRTLQRTAGAGVGSD